ncbi:hypothetical protein GCM10009774_26710 [Cellulomonas gelida]|uniref:Uncharacterized protein n=2 Tax=Cellulomonadaceae TaxID=85016 RepID=A0A4Y3KG96_9CELL|nr:hypothetical protein CGE01nite_01340 [Cellulomonas gelida]GGL34793.1 hypothetical protein GCM10009774_26710 [Cellulomonas gelida]
MPALPEPRTGTGSLWFGRRMLKVLAAVAALVVSVGGGWWFVSAVLRLASRTPTSRGASSAGPATGPSPDPTTVASATTPTHPGAADPAGPDGPAARAALRGGSWIGFLERLAVTACVLTGQPAGVAIVVAVKGLGRYPELKDNPAASERFVIGTLASLIWAAACGLAASLAF